MTLKDIDYTLHTDGFYYVDCDTTKYKSIFLRINGYYHEVLPQNYIAPITSSLVAGKCALFMAVNNYDLWILGDAFLRNFYAVHDMTNSRLGLAPAQG